MPKRNCFSPLLFCISHRIPSFDIADTSLAFKKVSDLRSLLGDTGGANFAAQHIQKSNLYLVNGGNWASFQKTLFLTFNFLLPLPNKNLGFLLAIGVSLLSKCSLGKQLYDTSSILHFPKTTLVCLLGFQELCVQPYKIYFSFKNCFLWWFLIIDEHTCSSVLKSIPLKQCCYMTAPKRKYLKSIKVVSNIQRVFIGVCGFFSKKFLRVFFETFESFPQVNMSQLTYLQKTRQPCVPSLYIWLRNVFILNTSFQEVLEHCRLLILSHKIPLRNPVKSMMGYSELFCSLKLNDDL